MPASLTVYRCLLISPTDVLEERDAIDTAIRDWNAQIGTGLQARIDLVRWESHARPEMGEAPQAVINRQLVDECDFGIAVFWSRLGSPTEEHVSGSAEEVERLLAKGANVMVYFSPRAVPQERLKDDQFVRLQALKEGYKSRGLSASYDTSENLAKTVILHVTNLVSGLLTKLRVADQPIPSTGTLTAPALDIRMRVRTGITNHGIHRFSALVIEVQNHSTAPFFFRKVVFSLSDGAGFEPEPMVEPESGGKVEPGDHIRSVYDATTWEEILRGRSIRTVVVVDKIDRMYPVDPFDFQDALVPCLRNAKAIAAGKT